MKPYKKLSGIPSDAKLSPYEIPGTLTWKASLEYPPGAFFGLPYFVIYKDYHPEADPRNYLFQLEPETETYRLIGSSGDMHAMWEKGMKLEKELREKLYPQQF